MIMNEEAIREITIEDACRYNQLNKLQGDTRAKMVNASQSLHIFLNDALNESYNSNLCKISRRLQAEGFTDTEATKVIYSINGHRDPVGNEIERAVDLIYGSVSGEPVKTSNWPVFESPLDEVNANIKHRNIEPLSEAEIISKLGDTPEIDSVQEFIAEFFKGVNQPVYIGNRYHGIIEHPSTWLNVPEIIEDARYDQVLANPMKRKLTADERVETVTDKDGKVKLKYASGGRGLEFASDKLNVITFEADKIPLELQLGVIRYIARHLPLVALLFSAGKSYHASFSTKGVDDIHALRLMLVDLGGDGSVMSPAQLTRLGAVNRSDKGKGFQRVLWMSGDARHESVDPQKLAELLPESAEDSADASVWERMQECAFDELSPPPHQPPLLGLDGTGILWTQNIHTLVAQSKAGKTQAKAAAMHTMFTGERTLGFTIDKPITGKIAYLDFEQDAEDFHSAMMRAGAPKERLLAYSLAGFSSKDAQIAARVVLEKNPDIVALFLDGYADLSSDVNDQESAVALAAEWMAMAKKHDVAILGVLHLNPNSDTKSRGHLGSQLERKSKVVLQIDTDSEGVRETYTRFSRKREVCKGHGVQWKWCDFEDGFVEISESKSEQKQRERVETMSRMAADVAKESTLDEWSHGSLVRDIVRVLGVTDALAKKYITQWRDNEVIMKTTNGYKIYEPF